MEMEMEKNVGQLDSNVRIVVGVVLVLIGIAGLANLISMGPIVVPVIAIIAGTILVYTGWSHSCPVYSATGMSTKE